MDRRPMDMRVVGPIFSAVLETGPARPAQAEAHEKYIDTRSSWMIETDADCVCEFLAELAKVCSPREIEHLAIHPDTPATALSHVARHPVAEIRAAVAENRNTPVEAIWQLVKDDDP